MLVGSRPECLDRYVCSRAVAQRSGGWPGEILISNVEPTPEVTSARGRHVAAQNVQIGNSAGRVQYLDTLRAVAIVAVVTIHVVPVGWQHWPVDSERWQAANIWDSLARFCVPIFFMVSGALFLDPSRHVTFSSIGKKSLPKIVVPFLVWSTVYAIVTLLRTDNWFEWKSFLRDVALGHYHLWFLLTIFGLYLVTPVLRTVVMRREVAWYFVGLSVVFAMLLPLLTHLPVVGTTVDGLIGKTKIELPLGFSVYFVLGYLLATSKPSRRLVVWWCTIGIAAVIFTVLATDYLSARRSRPVDIFYDYLTPNVCAVAIAVFLFAKWRGESRKVERPQSKWVKSLAKYSFGIYLVHVLVKDLYRDFGITIDMFTPLLSVPALVIMVLVPSYLVAVVLHNIPKVGKYLA